MRQTTRHSSCGHFVVATNTINTACLQLSFSIIQCSSSVRDLGIVKDTLSLIPLTRSTRFPDSSFTFIPGCRDTGVAVVEWLRSRPLDSKVRSPTPRKGQTFK